MSENSFSASDAPRRAFPDDVRAMIEAHPELDRSELEEIWHLTSLVEQVEPAVEPDGDAFDALKQHVQSVVNSGAHRPKYADRSPRRRIHLPAFRSRAVPAASAVLAAALVALVFWMRPVVWEAPLAGERSVTLPDGSRVALNSGSALSYRRSFGWFRRAVTLEGEGYFDVVGGDRPFVVSTFNGAVTVLGTRFNVRAWANDDVPQTEVVLEEGAVRFSASVRGGASVVLEPGELSRLARGEGQPTAPESVDTEKHLAWRRGGILFEDRPVGVVLNEVERRFDTHIHVVPESLRMERITLVFDQLDHPEEVLAAVAAARGLVYETSESGYVLRSSE